MAKKAVVIISGGMDSTTLLYDVKSQGYDIYAVSFNYNQRHKLELEMAKLTCEKLNVKHKIIDLKQIGDELLQGSSLTSSNIDTPHGHYAAENMKLTVVPNRNCIMLSLALGYAFSIEAEDIFYGAHAGDHSVYPDCRPEFLDAMNKVAGLADWKKAEIKAPYLNIDKGDIVKRGLELGVDYSLTYTCYEGNETSCGLCGSCTERIEAFKKANAVDPIKYNVEVNWK
jgi:7-cyano-7-deazaguanine synthase